MRYAHADHWDDYFRRLHDAGDDLDWGRRWIDPFLPSLRAMEARTVLELGCGSGNDAARLAREGFIVTALDFSAEAIEQARAKCDSSVNLLVADMAGPLPFRDASFDAVMSNVARNTSASSSADGTGCGSNSPRSMTGRRASPANASGEASRCAEHAMHEAVRARHTILRPGGAPIPVRT